MIYITFFIVILIDKRGVREAERETIRETIQIPIHITKRGKHPAPHTTAAHHRTHHR